MELIDIGANLLNSSFNRDREEVIKSAAAAGVSPVFITGSSEKSSREAALYASRYNEGEGSLGAVDGVPPKAGLLFSTAGVHPHEAKSCGGGTIDALRNLTADYKTTVKAIGECGLDYNRDFSPRDVQRKWFLKQVELAAELSLPLFLHERDAFADFSKILAEHIKAVPAAVVHCFTGTASELEYYISLGCYIGITGWICDERRGSHLRELVKIIPPNRLLLETDAPYLLPRDLPFKVMNKRNEPRFLPHVAETVAKCLGKETALLAKETFENAKRFFGLE